MQRRSEESGIQRMAEIVVVGPEGDGKGAFLHSFCPILHETEAGILLGEMPINRELVLYCYGIGYDCSFAWDLVGRKMLGYLLCFNWFDEEAYAACREMVTFASSSFAAPFVIAADHGLQPLPVPESAVRPHIALSSSARFLFYQGHKPASVRKVVTTLLDLLLEKL